MKKWIYRVLTVVCLGVFGYSAYNLWNIYTQQNQSETANGSEIVEQAKKESQENKEKGFEPDWNSLKAQFPDLVGWIYVPGCDTNYPVVQGGDNIFYLDHAANLEYSRYGAVFLNAEQPKDLTDDNTIIYGHSSDDGAIMTNIYNFNDEKFFNEHPYFYYLTPEKNYRCSIYIFAKDADAGTYYETKFSDESYEDEGGNWTMTKSEVMDYWNTHALYRRDMDITDKKFITISTCNVKEYGFYSDQRLILIGAIEEYNDPIVIND